MKFTFTFKLFLTDYSVDSVTHGVDRCGESVDCVTHGVDRCGESVDCVDMMSILMT